MRTAGTKFRALLRYCSCDTALSIAKNILAIAKLRDCSRSTSKATGTFAIVTLYPVGRASPLKTAIFELLEHTQLSSNWKSSSRESQPPQNGYFD